MNSSANTVRSTILDRLNCLKRIGLTRKQPQCSKKGFDAIGFAYGRTGNIILELMNALWLVEPTVLNSTLRLPPYMVKTIKHFRNNTILEGFCMSPDVSYRNPRKEMRSDELLNLYLWFKPNRMNLNLNYSHESIDSAATIWIQVLSILWSAPSVEMVDAAVWIIEKKFNHSFEYTTVHRRFMEGRCPKMMQEISPVSDYSPHELPMDHPSWRRNVELNESHPLCTMTLDFIQATQQLNNRSNQPIFLSHDGYEHLQQYRSSSQQVVTSDDLDMNLFPMFASLENRRFLDMFLAILGDFFIMNPRSTFSWSIYVVRVVLGLESVPIVKNRDLYFDSDADYDKNWLGRRWVSAHNIVEAARKLHLQIQ
jgi:hypothetical protein